VAEVAARFSLDAMPGKQLSIDSDLRSGLIDKDEARRRRRALELESKLHGSLDGAMKIRQGRRHRGHRDHRHQFAGGLAIGVMQQGLDIASAMSKFSILTVGEGMVAQIPALLGAMAAGLIVTRTTDDEHDKHLGDAIRKQITAKPRVLLVAGGICLLMSLVPGFPVGAFLALALVIAGGGLMLTPAWRERVRRLRHPRCDALVRRLEDAPQSHVGPPLQQPRPAVPLLLRVPARSSLTTARSRHRRLEAVLDDFQLGLGLPLPRISLHAQPDDAGWELLAFEVPIAQGQVPAQAPHAALAEAVRQALRRNAALFVGIQDATHLLTRASNDMRDVIKEVLRALPVARVAEVLPPARVGVGVDPQSCATFSRRCPRPASVRRTCTRSRSSPRIALKRQVTTRWRRRAGCAPCCSSPRWRTGCARLCGPAAAWHSWH